MENNYKVYAAWVSETDKFLVIASSMETAQVQAENIKAMFFLSHGIVLNVIKIQEYTI
jgi:hypothetical protein